MYTLDIKVKILLTVIHIPKKFLKSLNHINIRELDLL